MVWTGILWPRGNKWRVWFQRSNWCRAVGNLGNIWNARPLWLVGAIGRGQRGWNVGNLGVLRTIGRRSGELMVPLWLVT